MNGPREEDIPFINLVKTFNSVGSSDTYFPEKLNDKQYPVTTLTSTLYGNFKIPTSWTGNLVLKWSGAGGVSFGYGVLNSMEIVSDPGGFSITNNFGVTAAGVNGRLVFRVLIPNAGNCSFTFLSSTTYGSDFGNLVICREEDEAALDAGELFNPDFIAAYQAMGISTIRTLACANPNDGNAATKHSHRFPTDALSFYIERRPKSVWVGEIAGTDTYTCGPNDETTGTYVDGETVQGVVTNLSTTNVCTLNVNGKGAKSIISIEGTALPSWERVYAGRAQFTYSSLLDAFVYGGYIAPIHGWPIETCVALANATGCNLWVNIPHMYLNTSITELVTYVKNNLDTSLICYYEYSNEVWNYAYGYNQTKFCEKCGEALGFAATDNRRVYGYYALRSRELFGIVETVYGAQRNYQRVLAVQAFGPLVASEDYRLKGLDLTTGLVGTDYTAAPNRPVDHADVLSLTLYWGGTNVHAFDANYTGALTPLLRAADDYASGISSRMEQALDWIDNDVRAGGGSNTVNSQNANLLPPWNTMAATYGLYVDAYEGGFDPAAPSTARLTELGIDTGYSAKIDALITAYKNDERFRRMIVDYYRMWKRLSRSRAASWFLVSGTQWGIYPSNIYSSPYKSKQALTDYANPTYGGGVF